MLGQKLPRFADTSTFEGRRLETREAVLETQTGIFGTSSGIFKVAEAQLPIATTAFQYKRFSVPRLSLLLTIGIVIGATLFIAVGSHQKPVRHALPRLATESAPPVLTAPEESAAALAAPITVSIQAEGAAAPAAVVEELPSLQSHIEASPITLAARRFLFAEDSGRAIGAGFIAGKLDPASAREVKVPNHGDLKLSASAPGRFTAGGPLEWQGGFRPFDPRKNASTGQAYLDYLDGAVGNSLGKKLSVIEGDPTRLLDVVTKTGRGPGALRP
jgi:hypothetical protein